MATLVIVLLILSAVSFGAAAAGAAFGRINLVALGLLFWVCAALVPELT